jgi:transcriptional regulator of arginine metabolism
MVRRLIAAGGVHSQADLVSELAREGVEVTQATISRDLAALGVVRGLRGGRTTYLLPDDIAESPAAAAQARLRRLLADLPLEMSAVAPLLVLHTAPGSANAIASALDLSRWPEVVGTVAGDDTIFSVCPEAAAIERLRARLEAMRGGGAPAATSDGSEAAGQTGSRA